MKLNRLILIFIILLWLPANLLAMLPEQVENDFSSLRGVIIMPLGDEYLIDLDASNNLKEGDILTLAVPGEKVVHPVTQEILGNLDEVRGFLQVTKIKSGYSYAKLITAQVTPQKGDQFKRYEQVPALIDQTLAGTALAAELVSGLPQLNWIKEASTQTPLITFSKSGNKLNAINNDGVVVKSYNYSNGDLSATLPSAYAGNSFSINGQTNNKKSFLNKTVGNMLGVVGFSQKDKTLFGPGIITKAQDGGIWMGPNMNGNPIGLAVRDFDNDGQLETAVAMENELQIYRMSNGEFKQIALVEIPRGLHLLSLDTIDLNGNGYPELYLTANSGNELSSLAYEFQHDSYVQIQGRIPWFLRVVNLPQEGPTLLAQTMGNSDEPFAGSPFRLAFKNGKLSRGLDLPITNNINMYSFLSFSGTNNDRLYATISPDDYLSVFSPQGTQLWEADDRYGGTFQFFYNVKNTNKEIVFPIYIQQRLLSLPSGETLVPQNEGSRGLKRFRNFSKSRIIAMKWDGFMLNQSWRTPDQPGYLADYTLADADNDGQDELITAIRYSQKNAFQKGRSTIVIYELSQ